MEPRTLFLPRESFRQMAFEGHIQGFTGMSPFGCASLVLLDERIIFLGFGDCRQEVLRRWGLEVDFAQDDALILEVFSSPKKNLDRGLLFGTPFQIKVWRKLLEIPFGARITYSDLAYKIRAPKSLRAVAGAVGQNPVAYLVPCHRVVSKDGSLGGYHYGPGIKEKMLLCEQM